MKPKELKRYAQVFKVMGHPARLELLLNLSRERICVMKLSDLIDRRQANISQHLSLMRGMNLIDCEREGKRVCYFIKCEKVKKILQDLQGGQDE